MLYTGINLDCLPSDSEAFRSLMNLGRVSGVSLESVFKRE